MEDSGERDALAPSGQGSAAAHAVSTATTGPLGEILTLGSLGALLPRSLDPRVRGAAAHAVDGEVRLYDRLFTAENPESAAEKSGQTFLDLLNPASLDVLRGCKLEPMLGTAPAGTRVQFERLGYFCADLDTAPGKPVFNRTVSLKDTWAKVSARE